MNDRHAGETDPGAARRLDPDRPYRLSRHVQIFPWQDGLAVESLLSGRVQPLPNQAAVRLLLTFLGPTRPTEIMAQLPGAQRPAVAAFLTHCLENRLIGRVDESGRTEEDRLDSLRHWERHDLAFHLRSRRGRTPFPSGATRHLEAVVPEEPARRPPAAAAPGRAPIALSRPDLRALQARDWTLTRALEGRRSRYGLEPVPLEALSSLLHRACRITEVVPQSGEEPFVRRVYPSGGGRHSLETYLVTQRCPGLEIGGYRYDPFEHALEPHPLAEDDRLALLEEARVGTGSLPDLPSALLIFSARFRRVSRRYQSIAYHLILQEVGALYQTLYLVAETLGIGVSAIGAGDADRFASAFGTDYFAESSVGEMILTGPATAER